MDAQRIGGSIFKVKISNIALKTSEHRIVKFGYKSHDLKRILDKTAKLFGPN